VSGDSRTISRHARRFVRRAVPSDPTVLTGDGPEATRSPIVVCAGPLRSKPAPAQAAGCCRAWGRGPGQTPITARLYWSCDILQVQIRQADQPARMTGQRHAANANVTIRTLLATAEQRGARLQPERYLALLAVVPRPPVFNHGELSPVLLRRVVLQQAFLRADSALPPLRQASTLPAVQHLRPGPLLVASCPPAARLTAL